MSTYFDMSRSLAADHHRRLPCLALVAGREALIQDATETVRGSEPDPSSQRWMWPGPGDLEPAKIGGRLSTQTIYDIKLKGAVLDNVWERSLREVAAEPFTNEPALEGWPEQILKRDDKGRIISGWVTNLDGAGQNLLDIWREAFFLKIAFGISYRLIDLPDEPGGAPYWGEVNPAQITRLVPPLPGGLLREVAIKIPAGGKLQMPADDPGKLPEEPDLSKDNAWWVRVYRTSEYLGRPADGPVHFRHCRRKMGAKGKSVTWVETDWVPLEGRGKPFRPIPLLPFYGKRTSAYRGSPEFVDATSPQMSLWRSMTDYEMRKKNDYLNLLVVSGAKMDEVQQSARLLCLPAPQARGVAIETTGEAQRAAREDHEILRHRIRWACMRKIQQSKPAAQQTATEIRADVRGAGSWLEAQVLMDIATVEQGLRWTAELGGLNPEGGSVDLYHDFTEMPGSWESLDQTYRESEGRLVPPDLYWRERHRRGGIAADEDPGKIADEVDERLRTDSEL